MQQFVRILYAFGGGIDVAYFRVSVVAVMLWRPYAPRPEEYPQPLTIDETSSVPFVFVVVESYEPKGYAKLVATNPWPRMF